ncbi:phage tail protein [Stenotrophomonas lactitubi]|uniref:phage tail protein n=1 Tax=Stenotrophomonas lactitubi TaxID=2045214 RepID=UPI002041DCD2|nr:phage tail protein [Stenotrophomonas lactitubi]
MKKPASLRAAIEAAVPELATDKDRLLAFIDNGSIVCTGVESRAFEWRYTMNLIITDYAGDPNRLWLALLDWVRVNQSPLLTGPSLQEQIRFEVDILADDKVDLDIKIPLTENVVVAADDQGNDAPAAVDEPLPTWMT